jgi:hypothetical protein
MKDMSFLEKRVHRADVDGKSSCENLGANDPNILNSLKCERCEYPRVNKLNSAEALIPCGVNCVQGIKS